MNKKLIRWISWILFLGGILFTVSLFSLCVGSAGIPLKKIIALILEGKRTVEYSILFDIRLPRIILGFAVGSALSIAGVLLQGMFRNPLVEPYTLGISGGAALGVCLNIALRLSGRLGILSIPLTGFLGALIVVVVVYSLSTRKGIFKIQGLLLTGVMLSFICSSLVMLIMAISRAEDLHGIIFWIMGSLGEPQGFLIKVVFLVSMLGLFISYLLCADLNALSLGEEEAQHLGINVERTKRLLFLTASLLTGCSVSAAGIIGFVGLVVPHFMRMIVGSDHRILLVTSSLAGGAFLILCDTLARTVISPLELPVGVITGIVGGSLFVYALSKRQVSWGGK
ncbi:MAG: iron ABC transporter permease [Candidatus Omnitrophica bacterium]|nr:iron ABC transporter permease [Candidatus Omnitrophota bacterium]MBU4140775.1 iron ABC transporter permease [Candidatus Omnitrophota bacterium]